MTESTAGNATGIDATVRINANCKVSSSGSRRKSAASPDHENKADGDQDEEIADPQHRALEMRNALRLFDEMGGLAEIGVHAGGRDHAGHLALLRDRARIGVVAGLFVDRQRFAGQGRLIDGEIGAADQLQIGRDDVAELDQHDIARNQEPRLNVLPLAVAQHPRLQREALFEQRDGVVGLELLPEADPSVDEQHRQNNREVGPVPQQSRQHGRDLDHPGDRPPEEMGETLENTHVVLGKGVLAVLRKPPGGLGFTQASGLSFGCGRGHISRHLGVSVSRAHRPAPQLLQPLCIAADISCLPLWRHHDGSGDGDARALTDLVVSQDPGARLCRVC